MFADEGVKLLTVFRRIEHRSATFTKQLAHSVSCHSHRNSTQIIQRIGGYQGAQLLADAFNGVCFCYEFEGPNYLAANCVARTQEARDVWATADSRFFRIYQ